MPTDKVDETIDELIKTIGEEKLGNLKILADHRSGTSEQAILSQLLEWVKDSTPATEQMTREACAHSN